MNLNEEEINSRVLIRNAENYYEFVLNAEVENNETSITRGDEWIGCLTTRGFKQYNPAMLNIGYVYEFSFKSFLAFQGYSIKNKEQKNILHSHNLKKLYDHCVKKNLPLDKIKERYDEQIVSELKHYFGDRTWNLLHHNKDITIKNVLDRNIKFLDFHRSDQLWFDTLINEKIESLPSEALYNIYLYEQGQNVHRFQSFLEHSIIDINYYFSSLSGYDWRYTKPGLKQRKTSKTEICFLSNSVLSTIKQIIFKRNPFPK